MRAMELAWGFRGTSIGKRPLHCYISKLDGQRQFVSLASSLPSKSVTRKVEDAKCRLPDRSCLVRQRKGILSDEPRTDYQILGRYA